MILYCFYNSRQDFAKIQIQVFHSDARRRHAFAYIYGILPPLPPSSLTTYVYAFCLNPNAGLTPSLTRSFFMYFPRVSKKNHDLRTCQRDVRFILTSVTMPCFVRFPRHCLWLIFAEMNLVPDFSNFPELLVTSCSACSVVADAIASCNFRTSKFLIYKENKNSFIIL